MRVYDFPLPTNISGFDVSIGIQDLQDAGLWDEIPTDLQIKLQDGTGWFSGGVDVTADELNELPDDVWKFIADKLSLAWHQT